MTDYNFFKTNWPLCKQQLKEINWATLFTEPNVNSNWDTFYLQLTNAISKYTPKKRRKNKPYPVYFGKDTIHLMKRKGKIRKKYLKTKDKSDLEQYSVLRKKVKVNIKNGKKNYLKEMYADLRNNNTKPFWKYVRNLRTTNTTNILIKNDKQLLKNDEQAQTFNDYFASVYRNMNSVDIHQTIQSDQIVINHETLSNCQVTRQEVCMSLLTIKTDKAKGPDNIPPIFFKHCAWELSHPLTILFNQSLRQGIFPKALKLANISPIFKKREKTNVENYRPISLLSYPAKLFESLVHKQIYKHVNKYISPTQHGFCEGKSTNTNLCSFCDYVTQTIEEGCRVDVIYTDFSKAFDSVTHEFLVHKLSSLGIHGNLLSWCKSYLHGRTQQVIYNGGYSKHANVTSGVPQGSSLGPLFFIIFINDLALKLTELGVIHLFYADDLKLFFKIKSPEDHSKLQNGIDCLFKWCKSWGLTLNLGKCQVMTFHSYRNINPSYTIATP